MHKIFFPYNDQPKQFSFRFSEPIRFPFYVNDLVYYWEAGTEGITLYLLNNQIDPNTPIVKDILLEETGLTMYLVNEKTNTSKHIIVEFAKIGAGLETLGLLDPFTLGEIDPFTLGEISNCYANWMELGNSVTKPNVDKYFDASGVEMELNSNSVVSYTKDVYVGELENKVGIVGLNSLRHAVLGDLDPHTIGDIDAMLSTFRLFDSIPASLVKEIRIKQNYTVRNNTASPLTDFSVDGRNIAKYINESNIAPYGMIYSSSITDIDYYLESTSIAKSSLNKSLKADNCYIGISNNNISLEITTENNAE